MTMQFQTPPSQRAPERPAWLVSFADLMALLLAFFVLLYAMQRVEEGSWRALVESLSQTLRPVVDTTSPEPADYENVESLVLPKAINLSYLEVLLRGRQAREPALAGVVVRRQSDRLVIMLPSDLLFEPGKSVVVAGANARLAGLAMVLRNISNRIDVYGHTDPSPLNGAGFRSNWELSLSRAVMVADRLRGLGYRRPIATFGFADTRFSDVASVQPSARRFELARRVDIVVRATRDGR